MPTYEYACRSCGTHVEVYQRFSDPPLTQCGVCGGPLRKVFHAAGILFKGSGFYATDSRRGAAPDRAGKAEGASAGKEGSGKEGSGQEQAGKDRAGKGKPAAKPPSDSGKTSAASTTKESA